MSYYIQCQTLIMYISQYKKLQMTALRSAHILTCSNSKLIACQAQTRSCRRLFIYIAKPINNQQTFKLHFKDKQCHEQAPFVYLAISNKHDSATKRMYNLANI